MPGLGLAFRERGVSESHWCDVGRTVKVVVGVDDELDALTTEKKGKDVSGPRPAAATPGLDRGLDRNALRRLVPKQKGAVAIEAEAVLGASVDSMEVETRELNECANEVGDAKGAGDGSGVEDGKEPCPCRRLWPRGDGEEAEEGADQWNGGRRPTK